MDITDRLLKEPQIRKIYNGDFWPNVVHMGLNPALKAQDLESRADMQRKIGEFLETQCKDMDDLIRKLKSGTFKEEKH